MKLNGCCGTVLVLLSVALMGHSDSAASVVTAKEITDTATWFNSLWWPDLRGKPYVEITVGKVIQDGKVEYLTLRGFLLDEDARSFTVFGDGIIRRISVFDEGSWPFAVQKIPKSSEETSRVIDLGEAVKERLAELRHSKGDYHELFRSKVSDRTAIFVLARCCARQGRADLAEDLDKAAMEIRYHRMLHPETGGLTFQETIEKEIANTLMWKAVVDCGDATVSRPELLAQFERIVHDFPTGEHWERAVGFVEILRQMIAEDEAHARTAKPLEEMSVDEKAHELIFRLRDQKGWQWMQPGSCDVFGDMGGLVSSNSPAHQLVKLGHAAVPALIEALSDQRLSRSVGCNRDFYFSHFVLTVGDCAEAVLSRIAGRSFWVPGSTFAAMQKDGQLDATRTAVEAWWRKVRRKR